MSTGEVRVGLTGCHSILDSRTGTVTFTAIDATGEVAAPSKLKLRY